MLLVLASLTFYMFLDGAQGHEYYHKKGSEIKFMIILTSQWKMPAFQSKAIIL